MERFLAPEILFNPELVGQEYPGVHQVIVDSINRTDLDLRKSLFSNIVLSGGSTLCTGRSSGPAIYLGPTLHDFLETDRGGAVKRWFGQLMLMRRIGFGDRLLNEVKKLALKDVKLKIYAPPERKVRGQVGSGPCMGWM